MKYYILGPIEDNEQLYWSNEQGWVDKESATIYTEPIEVHEYPMETTGTESIN